jgi:hypothetical protein
LVYKPLIDGYEDVKASAVCLRSKLFRSPAQPIRVAILTVCPASRGPSFRGRHSSRRMRAGKERFFRYLERLDCLLAAHGREIVEELVETVPSFEVIDEVLDRHARTHENWNASEYLWVRMNDVSWV